MATAPNGGGFVIVGRIRKAHGLRGELIVESITDAPDAVFAPGRRLFAGTATGDLAPDRQELHVVTVGRQGGAGWRIQFAEIAGRTAAELWRDRYLLVPDDEREPLAEGEVYLHELTGMRVADEAGGSIGVVAAYFELRQGLVLEVGRDGNSVMIPYGSVRSADRATRTIVVELPAGLLD